MKIASVADVKAKLSSYVDASSDGAVVITRNGKAVAAIVPVADEEDLERLAMAYSPKLRAILGAAKSRIDAGKGIAHEDFWRGSASRKRPRKNRHHP